MPKSTKVAAKHPAPQQVGDEPVLPSRAQLSAQWRAAFGRPLSPAMRRPLAAHLLRFHARELAAPPLAPEVTAYLASLLPKARQGATHASVAHPRRLKPGTRLLRTWHGQTYLVTVADPGFVYEGITYSSLSLIAKKITGTPWSGPAFFGLNKASAGRTP